MKLFDLVERSNHDPGFCHLVRMFEAFLHKEEFTVQELRDALKVAALKVADRTIRPQFPHMPRDSDFDLGDIKG